MAELISRVRLLIGDPAGANQTFSDDEVQDALDRTQTVVRYAPLRPEPTPLPNGTVEYRDYYALVGDWEASEQLVDGAWQQLTPVTRDRLTGHWTFASPGQNPPVYITGAFYDVAAAAATLLEFWAGKVKLAFDFETDGQRFARSQQAQALLTLAAAYRRQQRAARLLQVRQDIEDGGSW